MNSQLVTTEAEFNITDNVDQLNMAFTLTDKGASKPDPMTWVLFSDDNLKACLSNFSKIAPPPLTCNDILHKFVVDPNATWTSDNAAVSYNVDYTQQGIYIYQQTSENLEL